MHELIKDFISGIQNKQHLMLLINKLDLCLNIEAGNETFHLYFKHGVAEASSFCTQAEDQVILVGNEKMLSELFNGKIKLREGERLNYFTIKGSFRSILVLESIFHLSRPTYVEIII
ncbi:hypothetical protein [Mesobacillus subterraneus]|uniref:SCP2 domain-containing protein n=1 Tax=Mesobacillus subterraneus TaxID=285983 RepID=A0A3R9DVJ7_9BACI|nr:hypothetical protein [Mesobacillus subterraneus]RSD28331.1 hypothetical protein EJA10_05460 [Mesobacillus subterraneus]